MCSYRGDFVLDWRTSNIDETCNYAANGKVI
jgi:hypothetical protein